MLVGLPPSWVCLRAVLAAIACHLVRFFFVLWLYFVLLSFSNCLVGFTPQSWPLHVGFGNACFRCGVMTRWVTCHCPNISVYTGAAAAAKKDSERRRDRKRKSESMTVPAASEQEEVLFAALAVSAVLSSCHSSHNCLTLYVYPHSQRRSL